MSETIDENAELRITVVKLTEIVSELWQETRNLKEEVTILKNNSG